MKHAKKYAVVCNICHFSSILAVFHSIRISIKSSCDICTHFTWSKLIKLPIYNQKRNHKRTIQFLAIYTQLEYWHSILQHHEQFYIIFLDGSHFTWSKLMKIPMHLKYARLTGEYHKKFSFLTIYAILQYLGSISQYCIVIERKTCFELALHQNRPRAANFVGKRWIHNDFGWFLQLLLFWSSSVGLFWPLLGAQSIPNTKIWTMLT